MSMLPNEYLRRAASFCLILILLFLPYICAEPRPKSSSWWRKTRPLNNLNKNHHHLHRSIMSCQSDEQTSYWLRNACYDGYVTVMEQRRKVVAQHEALNKHSPPVEIVKETCQDSNSPFGLVTIRLFNPSSKRYICFNRRGQVKSMTKRRAERMGRFCAFYELSAKFKEKSSQDQYDPSHYVQLRSAHNTSWYLGFNRRKRRISHTRQGHAFTLPKMMLESRSKRPRQFNPHKCDFLFATGEYSKTDLRDEWSGLFRHVQWRDALANALDSEKHDDDEEEEEEEEEGHEEEEEEAISVITRKAAAATLDTDENSQIQNNNYNEQKESALEKEEESHRLLKEVVTTMENNIENLKWKVKSYVPEELKTKRERSSLYSRKSSNNNNTKKRVQLRNNFLDENHKRRRRRRSRRRNHLAASQTTNLD